MAAAAANRQVAPAQPHSERAVCTPHAAPANRGRSQTLTTSSRASAKAKRPAVTWKGCSALPETPRPSAFASSEVTAMIALAPTIRSAALASAAPVRGEGSRATRAGPFNDDASS